MRNQNSLFSTLPSVNIKRSKFRRPQNITFTGNVGVLIPFYWDEVLPGDTHQLRTSKVVRLQTPITPFYGQMYLDTYYFFVPNRLIWNHWKEFMGENSTGPWIPQNNYTIPQMKAVNPVLPGSVPDYLGVPIGITNLEFSALPIRGYYKIWNEWFRDENLQYPVIYSEGDGVENLSAINNTPFDGSSGQYGSGRPMMVSKFHDFYTSALPGPQKGNSVTLGMTGNIPVIGDGNPIGVTDGTNIGILNTAAPISYPGSVYAMDGSSPLDGDISINDAASGLVADLSGVTVATINQLRTAFQIQKLLETDARGGSRYTEIIRAHFGIVSPDARLQRPEYLGGNRIPINVHQVVQSSETGTTPQGTTAAYSLTVDQHGEFAKSFTEHGIILGLMCVRYDHVYQQQLERAWSRKTKYDFYWPTLAHLGEQEIKCKEIYAQGPSAVDSDGNQIDEKIFGFQERWAEYRYKQNRVAGQMRSNAPASLDVWHLADDYQSLPALSAGWIVENKSNVDRVLQVSSSVANQLLFDVYVENDTTRPMPVHSIPGLVDHF